jgi:glutaredoxin 3
MPIVIYGRSNCPHTRRALDAHPDATFIDVRDSPEDLEEMLRLTDGKDRIPVIVENGQVCIGFKRGS